MNRHIAPVLLSRLKAWRSVALMGSRQVGKSHLRSQIVSAHPGKLLSFDDPLERMEASRDPVRYIENRYKPGEYLFIDEAARVPEIFSAVKIIVDRHGSDPTGICLANSGNYLLLRKIKESLAWRVNLLSMYPFSWQEFGGYTHTPGLAALCKGHAPSKIVRHSSLLQIKREREERMLWGGMPLPSLNPNPDSRTVWARDYVRTYILPLVIEQFNIRDSGSFEQAARLLMLQNGRFFNASPLAQNVGVSQPTLKSYSHFLEAMMVIEFVPVFLRNLNKRLTKQPKIYVTDPLLFNQSLDNFSIQKAVDTEDIGRISEGFVFAEIKKTISNNDLSAQSFNWRAQDKAEVDLVLAAPGNIVPLEVKWSTRLTTRDASGLRSFLEDYPEAKNGYIVYPGDTLQHIAKNILAIPDWWLLGCY